MTRRRSRQATPPRWKRPTVSGAVRTDLILSGPRSWPSPWADVAAQPILTQAAVLVVVGVAMTIAVYGAVGRIVKMDDIGLVLARRDNGGVRGLGRGLVKGMPVVMSALSVIGTAAMLWVGGGILVHGSHTLGMHWPAVPLEHLSHAVAAATGPLGPVTGWLTTAVASAVVGLIVGGLVVLVVHQIGRLRGKESH